MRRTQVFMAAGGLLAAALIGGTLISAAFAARDAGEAARSAEPAIIGGGEYCEVYLDTLATELGVDRAALSAAGQAAANAVVDAALADGEIDEERATELRERIAEVEGDECAALGRHWLGGPGRGGDGVGPGGLGLPIFQGLEAAADALGVEQRDVLDAFRDGTTLQELAEQQGVAYETVSAAVTDAVRGSLDDAVADADITQERADEILARVEDWLADGGEPMALHRGRGPGGP